MIDDPPPRPAPPPPPPPPAGQPPEPFSIAPGVPTWLRRATFVVGGVFLAVWAVWGIQQLFNG
jgi:hypothetical protein